MSKILIVDDELGIREMLSDILTDEGHTVYTADSAEAARVFVLQDKYDLILLDIWMPDTDGITLLKEWGQRKLLHCPVVMMSGHGTIENAVRPFASELCPSLRSRFPCKSCSRPLNTLWS